MPASTTRVSAAVTSTLPGLRSWCTAPAPWMVVSASASSTPSRRTPSTDSGPHWARTVASDGPGTYSAASHGTSASRSPPSRAATPGPRIPETISISFCRQDRKRGSAANSGRITRTATRLPLSVRPRWTRPVRPTPSTLSTV